MPHAIATDNYFVNRDQTPRDEKGQYDFESLAAMDVEQFNLDMSRLLRGETVEMPRFNFKKGMREYNGDKLTLGPKDVLVIEGIHCLNDAFSYSLPKESKFKIYISCLTTLNVDDHNRIPTTDARAAAQDRAGCQNPWVQCPERPSACGLLCGREKNPISSRFRTAQMWYSTRR